ncbi:hypothetical protein Hanom_Chr17g01528911 [Helianthus anomalus]
MCWTNLVIVLLIRKRRSLCSSKAKSLFFYLHDHYLTVFSDSVHQHFYDP